MKIKSIKKIKNDSIHYDVQVEKNHNFFASGVLTHNCNLPARNVIIVGVTRGLNEVDELDIIQESGRAGRYGIDDQGDCYLICDNVKKWQHIIKNPREIESTLVNEGILGFHILAEIKNNEIFDRESLEKWFERSLAKIQDYWDDDLVDKVVLNLKKMGMIRITNTGRYSLTRLGMVSAVLYYLPQNIYSWNKRFSELDTKGLWHSDLALSFALGSAPSYQYGYVPRADKDRVGDYVYHLNKLNCFNSTFQSVKATDLYELLCGNSQKFTVRDIQFDGGRISQALGWISKIRGWNKESFWKALPTRLKYGIGRDLVALCELPGIGAIKARKLYSNGIRSLEEVETVAPRKLKGLLGETLTVEIIQYCQLKRRGYNED